MKPSRWAITGGWPGENQRNVFTGIEVQMSLAVPLPIEKIEAANRLHERLEQWRLADQALRLLANRCPLAHSYWPTKS